MAEIKPFKTETEREVRLHEVRISGKTIIPSIKYSIDYQIPQNLIKYYKADENGYNVLKQSKIWASNPLDFNDPFDCPLQMWDLDSFPYEEIKNFLNDFLPGGLPPNSDILKTRQIFFGLQLRLTGIYCLNEKLNSDLFWGYYNNHTGFSIEFNTRVLNAHWGSCPLKVEYGEMESFHKLLLLPDEFENLNVFPKILRWTTIKKNEGKHENEWRYVFFDIDLGNTNRLRRFPSNAINKITLGFRFFKDVESSYENSGLYKYKFKIDDNTNYSLEILKASICQIDCPIYQIALTEDFKLFHQRIFIKEINGTEVTILREFDKTQLEAMDS
jgi:hypothetical protein